MLFVWSDQYSVFFLSCPVPFPSKFLVSKLNVLWQLFFSTFILFYILTYTLFFKILILYELFFTTETFMLENVSIFISSLTMNSIISTQIWEYTHETKLPCYVKYQFYSVKWLFMLSIIISRLFLWYRCNYFLIKLWLWNVDETQSSGAHKGLNITSVANLVSYLRHTMQW